MSTTNEWDARSCVHPDCDGWRLAHRIELDYGSDRRFAGAHCHDCDWRSVGTRDASPAHKCLAQWTAEHLRTTGSMTKEIPCDGRCADWSN